MTEAFDQWQFGVAAYAVVGAATRALVGWSGLAMKAAEKRRDRAREE